MTHYTHIQIRHLLAPKSVPLSVLALTLTAFACCSIALAQPPSWESNDTVSIPFGRSVLKSTPHGIARPCQRATMSAPLSGMLVEVLVGDGDNVKKGRVLAVMDNRVAMAAVRAAHATAERTADVEHSRHALALARSLFARHSSLKDLNGGAAFELEQAKAQRDQAEATLASALEAQMQARRNLEVEESRLEAHNIRAPFDGQVIRIETTVGTTLTLTDKLLTIICLDSLEAELHVPLELFGELQVGETYELAAFSPVDRSIRARLAFASPMIDTASKTFRCIFTIDNRDHRLPAGFGVRFDLPLAESRREDGS